MMQLVLYFAIGCNCLYQINAKCSSGDDNIEGYYWRHYSGKIPSDALLGGTDENGNLTYVGQTVFRGILIPGPIIQAEQKMTFEWGDIEHSTTKNIKILCTKEPHRFEWIRTNTEDIANLTEKNFIYGGFESDFTVYIGRVQINDELAVGKVLVTANRAAGFHTTSNGTFVFVSQFEVLNYDADVPDLTKIRKSLAERHMYHENSAAGFQCSLVALMLVFINYMLLR